MSGYLLTLREGQVDRALWAIGFFDLPQLLEFLEGEGAPFETYHCGGEIWVVAVSRTSPSYGGRYIYWPEKSEENWPDKEKFLELTAVEEPDLKYWVRCPEHGGFWSFNGCRPCQEKEMGVGAVLFKEEPHVARCSAHQVDFLTSEVCERCREEKNEPSE